MHATLSQATPEQYTHVPLPAPSLHPFSRPLKFQQALPALPTAFTHTPLMHQTTPSPALVQLNASSQPSQLLRNTSNLLLHPVTLSAFCRTASSPSHLLCTLYTFCTHAFPFPVRYCSQSHTGTHPPSRSVRTSPVPHPGLALWPA